MQKPKLVGLLLIAAFITALFVYIPVKLLAQDDDECLACHEDKELTMTKGKQTISLFVNNKKLKKSIHSGIKCVQCHVGFNAEDIPHTESPTKFQCSSCHKNAQTLYEEGLHGKAKAKKDPLAPTCKSCHGSHEILPKTDKASKTYPLNIPKLCGACHREGSPVSLQRNIPETHILENYTESIHGEGLIKKGLTVSATCASCHGSHRVLPHTDPRSTIARKNIAGTCATCHAGIEFVHKKIIRGELWEKEAQVLPACIDCHQPHKVRNVFYEQNYSDEQCKKCHENSSIGKSADGRNMFIKHSDVQSSVHNKLTCTQCHVGVQPSHKRPCDNLQNVKIECSSCHEAVGKDFSMGTHGKLLSRNDKDAPNCWDCHGTHKMLPKTDPNSMVFPLNIPKLCAKCHQEGKAAAVRYKGKQHSISTNYAESIHGKGLMKSGLTVTATCADCHSAHKSLPKDDPNSSINPKNVSSTCGRCHFGIEEEFHKSIHSPNVSKTDKKLPVCYDCHSAHSIRRIDEGTFRYQILSTCGKCHSEIAETYFETYHGKVSRLGSTRSAKCGDCHGSHNILSINDPNSTISRKNIVQTCQKCHKNATKGFTKYLSHATHHDKDKYPLLFYTFWGMTLLLLGTFSMSFLHTLLWLPRSLQMRKKMKQFHSAHSTDNNPKLYQRFSALNRLLHFTMIVSFLTLAATGMVLKFSYTPWSQIISSLMGGVDNAGVLHRFAATMLFGVFFAHIVDLFAKKKNEFGSWKAMLFDKDSMLPNKKDWKDVKDSIKWFLGKGGRPNYGRWTYWEKFDYFAVFWGIFVIGGTGLTLWFPVFITKLIPGSFVNIATIIHSDEALLAAGFIFTVHFFNTHFRPEKFPMDTVIFSGQMTLEELKLERPAEYNALAENGELEKYLRPPFSAKMLKLLKIFGWIALTLGLLMVVWIIYGLILS